MQAKINPYLRPLLDALREMMDYDQIKRYTEQDLIEMIPLAYMRGRTLNEAFVILDEAQNTTVAQMKMFLTRMGLGTKMVVSGDTTQIDLPAHARSGLIDAIDPLARDRRFLPRDARQLGHCASSPGAGDRPRLRRGTEAAPLNGRLNATGGNQQSHACPDSQEHGVAAGCTDQTPADGNLRRRQVMNNGTRKRTRSERVAALELPPGLLERTWEYLQRGDVLVRLGLLRADGAAAVADHRRLGAAAFLSDRIITPLRNIVARVHFQKPDPQRTSEAQERAQREVRSVYEQDKEPLVQLRAGLQNQVARVLKVQSLAELDDGVWQEFFAAPKPEDAPPPGRGGEQHFQAFREALTGEGALKKLEKAVADAHAAAANSTACSRNCRRSRRIAIRRKSSSFPRGGPTTATSSKSATCCSETPSALKKRLKSAVESPEVADRVFDWLRPQLIPTLSLNNEETRRARDEAEHRVHEVYTPFEPGDLSPGPANR